MDIRYHDSKMPVMRILEMAFVVRRAVSRAALPLMLIAGFAAQAQTVVVENADGSISITVDGGETTLPATLADSILAALRENAGDPQGLREAVRTIVAGNAGGADGAALASVIAAFAAFRSNGDSEVVAAIVGGVAAGNPVVTAPELLSRLPEGTAGGTPLQAEAPATADPPPSQPGALSTAENPQQVASPAI